MKGYVTIIFCFLLKKYGEFSKEEIKTFDFSSGVNEQAGA